MNMKLKYANAKILGEERRCRSNNWREQHEPSCVALDRTSPLSPVNRFPLNFLTSSGSFLFLVASGSAFHLWSLGYACRRGLISRVKVYWFLTRLRGGVVSYERFCLPLRVRCDEVKLLPVGDLTDPSGVWPIAHSSALCEC